MSTGENPKSPEDKPYSSSEATADQLLEFSEQQILDSVAVQWVEGLLKFIEVFWYENGEFNNVPPQDEKLKGILGYIPVEIALVSSWLGEQLVEWEKSVPKQLIADARSAILLASSVSMICLQFIRMCKEVAERKGTKVPESCLKVSQSVASGNSNEYNEVTDDTNAMYFEWETYQFLHCDENSRAEYLTYESVKNILETLESSCKDQEKLILEKLFKEIPNTNENFSIAENLPLPEELQETSESSVKNVKKRQNLQVSRDGEELFSSLIKDLVSVFSSTEGSPRSTHRKRRLKRLAYAQAKREPSDNEESLTLVIESAMGAVGGMSCETKVTDNSKHSTGVESSGDPGSTSVDKDESLGIRVFNVYEGDSTDHVLLSVPADHSLKWGNEAEAPPELLLFIRMQNWAIETWEMITEAKISNTFWVSEYSKECIKGVFNSLYKSLQALKTVAVIKSRQDINISLFLRGLSLKAQNNPQSDSSDSDKGPSQPDCSRTLLSHDYGIKKGSISLMKRPSLKVSKGGEFIQLIIKVPLSSTSTTASEASSEEETEH